MNIRIFIYIGSPNLTLFRISNGTDGAELARKPDMTNKWYQIYTKSNSEKKLYEKIRSLEFIVFLPVRKLSKKWSDRVKIIEEPAFRSYIFAKLDYDQMRCVEKLTEFCFFISYGASTKSTGQKSNKIFPEITDKTIEQITTILKEYPEATLVDKILTKGDKIEITQGSLKNYQGIIMQQPSGHKVAVKLHGLKQSLLITVPALLLSKIA